MTTTLPNRIIKYFVDTSNPSQSGFYFYEKAGTGGFVRLGALADASRAGGNTFEIDSSTAEDVIYNGLGGADTYVVRSNLDKNIEISDPHSGDDGSGNEAKNTIVFDSDVTVTSISANQVTRLEGTGGLRIELTLDTGAVITVNGPDVFEYVVGGAAALDFAGFIATYGASGITPANRAPVFENVPTDLSIDENADGSAAPVSVGYVVASDADASDSLTYSIVSAVDQNGGSVTGFEVDGAGLVTYVGTGLDAEAIASVALTVSVSDGQESAQASVAISVADLNDVAPTITSGATGNALTECVAVPNTQVIYAATGVSDITDITWTLSGPDAGLFNIDRATGEVRFNTETTPDHGVKDGYNFTVVATSGSLAAVEQAVTIAVTDIDEINASPRVTSDGNINAAVAGDVLTFRTRPSDPDGTFTYQWHRDGVDIAGATAASYRITEGDEGNSLYVVAHYTYSNGGELIVTPFGIIVPASVDNADSSSTATPSEAPAILSLADLNPASGFRIYGEPGWAVSSAGDVNGDGIDDFAIGTFWGGPLGSIGEIRGSTYVVFGKANGFNAAINLRSLNAGDGFRIDGENFGLFNGEFISAGDVNGDGYDDIIIGAYAADYNGGDSGSTYVVFGKESGFRTTDLSELDGSDGFRIDGESAGDFSGYSVATGDVNGDGYDDVIIGAQYADYNGINSGSTYVVFGKESGFSRTTGLSELDGSDGFRIDGENSHNSSGDSVSSAGDINGDGYDDIIVSAPQTHSNEHRGNGSSYVIFGKESGFSRTMNLSELDGSNGFRMDLSGRSISSAGDINGDGYDDIIIGASRFGVASSLGPLTYVVFGKESGFSRTVDLSELDGSDGFGINRSGVSVSSAGDFNGDGYDDIIIGAPRAGLDGNIYGQSSYVVFGKESGFSRRMDLSKLHGSDGFRIDGGSAFSFTGLSVSSAGDVNDDGYDDIMIGKSSYGTSYIIYGYATLSIDENADGSTVLVSVGRVVATDADASDTLTYSIVTAVDQNGDSVTGFEVDGAGLVTYVGTGLDAETITSVALTVSASDGEDSAQTSVAISVVDLNDVAPMITSGASDDALTEGVAVPNTQVIYTATGTSDVTDISWSLSGPDAGLFNIDRATGEVRFETETTPEHEGKDSYSFTVVATSGALPSVTQDVTIEVTNIDEGNASFGVTSDRDINAAVAGDVLTVGLRSSDPDGDGTFSYQWYRDGVDIAGATGASYTITEADGGNSLYVAVRYTDGSGTDETVTASGIVPTATVLNLADLDPTDFTSTIGFRLIGEKYRDWSGEDVSSVGDINDDGYDDFAIGAPGADPNGEDSGATYVIFGKATGFSRTIELSELDGSDGFRIDGESVQDTSGRSISAGDVNDDGYNDIIIGADWAAPNGYSSGSTYVVFGKESGFSKTIDLSDIVRIGGGVRIDGESAYDDSGKSVSSGDVNDDGYDDIIIGAPGADPNGYGSGSTYVVFGKADGSNGLNGIMELSELDGSDGFRIDGESAGDASGHSVSSAGDVNGDGYDDFVIGAYGADPNGERSGSSYVVFGKESGFDATVNLSDIATGDGSAGFRINGGNEGDQNGFSVSSAGDFNGDGYDDIIIGAQYADPNGEDSGATYVVFGKASGFSRTIELSELDGSDGFRLNGESTDDYSGRSVSSAGDFNGDGYDDIIIGAAWSDPNGDRSGSSYVVFGKSSGFSRTIELSELDGSDGFRIDGEDRYDRSGYSVSSAGDVNDDGYDDIIIGTKYGGRTEGHSYVIYGHATSSVTDVDEGNASFVVTSNRDLNAAVAGDVLTVGLRSSDPDGDGTFSYQWYRDGVDIAGATGASYTITEADGGNSLYVVVRYTDGSGADETVTASGVIVPVPANRTPVFENEPTDLSLNENADGSAVPVSVGRVAASDADAGDTLTYTIVNAVDQNGGSVTGFEVDGTGLIIYVGTGLNAETITSVALTVSASDGEESAQTSVAISVTNIDEGNASFVVTSDDDINAAVAGDVLTVRLRSSDPDGDGTFTYQWYRDGADIADATSTSYTITEADGGNSLYVAVRYTDGSGADETVTASGVIVPVSEDNADSSTTATPAVLNLADLTPATGFRLVGGKERDFSGSEVSSVGDINDDGYDDFAIGAYAADPNGERSGSTYVVFGKASGFSSTIELSELDGSDGFRIDGENPGDYSGLSVSSGDVNDDGYNDIIIGAHFADPNGNKSGSTYVVFGKESGFSETIDLSDIVRIGGGVRIGGENRKDYSGSSVSSGDVNDDGYDDIIIGASGADRNGNKSGSTYVVFGKADGPNGLNGIIELSELDGNDGFRIDGVNRKDYSGSSVSAGDINGDGYDDIIIGANWAEPDGGNFGRHHNSGSTYVVFGKESGFSRTIDLSELDGSDGFRIDGENAEDHAGISVSSAGDIDGDGYDDIIIGAPYVDSSNGFNSGSTYVVFGKASGFSRTIDLSELDGSDGFRIDGESAGDWSGHSVSSAGDFNGDGYDDIIIGAYNADPNGSRSGSTYVVFGKESGFSRTIELSELDASDGFRIDGENERDYSGSSVSSAGDVNDDGYDDIIIGAWYGGRTEGHSYVIYGYATSVTNIDEGNASFVVTSDRDINAAVAGDVLTVGLRSSDPDGDGTFSYQWYRDGVDIAGATGASYTIPEDYDGNSIYVVVRYTDGSGADETITASGIIVPLPVDNDDDASEDPVNTTYTMTQAPTGVSLTRGGVALSVGETFTYQDIQGGSVALTVNDENALSGLKLTTDDGTDANPSEISLDIEVREVADIAAPEAGNNLDYSENEGSLVIDTGDYGDQITAAQGSDFITGGLGDDTINLDPVEGRETGQDTVVYNFGSGSIFTATDGGDDITGFKRGEDIFLLKTESDNPELATLDGLFSYVSGPNKGSSHDDLMIVRPNYEYEPDGSGGLNFFLTGIEFHFEDGGVYGNGYLAQGHVSITFDERLPWEEFLSLIEIDNGNGSIDGNFDHRRGIIRDLSTLPNLMGEGSLAYEVEAPAQTPPQDVDVVPLEDDIPATSFDVV